jgi:hypothetical protein
MSDVYGWGVYILGSQRHVWPVDENHTAENCRCQPTLNEDGIMVHASYDGRELFESGERKPS